MNNTLRFNPLPNKYTRWYFQITSFRKENPISCYSENHHIHPDCLGGTKEKTNMVRLTAREHYICHLLLTKMLVGEPKKRMAYAFRRMGSKKDKMERYIPNSHIYQIIRAAIDYTPGEETRRKMSESGKKRPPITEQARKNRSIGVAASYTPELRALRSKNFSNMVVSDFTRQEQSKRRKGWAHMCPDIRERARQNLSARMSAQTGERHPKSKTWTLQSPVGETFVTKDMTVFCAEHSLNYSSLRNRARAQSLEPLTKGSSKGWVVIRCV